MQDTGLKTGPINGRSCTKCGEWKLFAYFHKSKDAKYGHSSHCKECIAEYTARRRADPEFKKRDAIYDAEYTRRPDVKSRQEERDVKRRKTEKYKERAAELKSTPEYRAKAATAEAERRKNLEYAERMRALNTRYRNDPVNKAKKVEYNAEYKSRPKVKERRRQIRALRRKKDPIFLAEESCRNILKRHLDLFGQTKSVRTSKTLGYTPSELRDCIEKNFLIGMSWENRSEWHIDHTKPISAFLSEGITDPKIVNALANLRPLWIADNLSKGSKWPLAPTNDNNPNAKKESA